MLGVMQVIVEQTSHLRELLIHLISNGKEVILGVENCLRGTTGQGLAVLQDFSQGGFLPLRGVFDFFQNSLGLLA